MHYQDYTIGWICALPTEMAAAVGMLDSRHDQLPQPSHDTNIYSLGSIGAHNVVIACLPAGVTGTTSAAIVATRMRSTFASMRFGLMVGIGGGVPSQENDIRLGDVVVSKPGGTSGGVIQYDFGKTIQAGRFVRTGSLNRPPDVLLNAVASLQAKHMMEDPGFSKHLSNIISKYPKLRDTVTYQGLEHDILFAADYDHREGEVGCTHCDINRSTTRDPRKGGDPAIHYGLIASGNQVMRDGSCRDRLRKELNVLCFEMEAAGLMDNFPCLVIRGICDYADSHKNKRWQAYAATTAAAYAKELLYVIPQSHVVETPSVVEEVKQTALSDFKFADPRADKNRIEVGKDILLKDSSARVLDDPNFRDWRDNDSPATNQPYTINSQFAERFCRSVMDPLTAISLAGTVVQFVDFSYKLIKAGSQLYEGGELKRHAIAANSAKEVQNLVVAVTKDLQDYRTKLQKGFQSEGVLRDFDGDEAMLENLCCNCNEVADILMKRLNELNIPENTESRGWHSIQHALLSVWSKKDVEQMIQRLSEYRNAITSRVLLSLAERVDLIAVKQSDHFNAFTLENQQIITALLSSQNSATEDLQVQILALSQLLNRTEVVVADQEDRTRRIIVDVFERAFYFAQTVEEWEASNSTKECERLFRESIATDLLDSLRFPAITERFEEVIEAHRKTFQWIFRKPEDGVHAGQGKRWSDFPEWLQHGDGIYWINGKAASGKSTLMKFICLHPNTFRHLREWAANSSPPAPLCTAGFFFWISGTKEQKSQTGLLRSLLHDILTKNRGLIPVVLPKQWSSQYLAKLGLSGKTNLNETWALSELKLAFKTLIFQDQIPIKLCLFIDGLDEYDGDEDEIAKLFGDVSTSPNSKCCVTSRPHLAFEDAFVGRPGLRLQDLTFPDIRQFVRDKLENDERMQRLSIDEPDESPKLIEEIITSANGVFLWVKLVVASLLRGLTNRDQISTLQARLRTMPRKLEDLYLHIMLRIEEIYQEEASRLYQLVAAASNKRAEDWTDMAPLTLIGLSMAEDKNPDLALTAEFEFLTESEIHIRCNCMGSLLISRCGGLIEIQHGDRPRNQLSPSMKVSYLHRTVKDYLEKRETKAALRDWTGGKTANAYNPNLAMLKSCILQLKLMYKDRLGSVNSADCISSAALYARRVEADTASTHPELIDEFFQTASRWMRRNITVDPIFDPEISPLALAVGCGLYRYLRVKLTDHGAIAGGRRGGTSLLEYALVPSSKVLRFTAHNVAYINVDVVSTLLDFGVDPTEPWRKAVCHLHENFGRRSYRPRDERSHLQRWTEIIKRLIAAGVVVDSGTKLILQKVFLPYPQFWNEIERALRVNNKRSKLSRLANNTRCRQQ